MCHLRHYTFKKIKKYLYSANNIKTNFLQLSCFDVLLHLKYKVSTCEPETEFNKLAGGKALATDHRVNFTYFSHNYDNYSMFRDVPECRFRDMEVYL